MNNKNLEEWKDVPYDGYSKLYQVSSLGRVRRKEDGYMLKISENRCVGYNQVCLHCDGRQKLVYVHNLVMLVFGEQKPNDDFKYFVKHKDGNKLNDFCDNLFWSTIKEAVTRHGGYKRLPQKKEPNHYFLVKQLTADGVMIGMYHNFSELEKKGYNKYCILQASRSKYGKKGSKIYKNYSWEVEKIMIKK